MSYSSVVLADSPAGYWKLDETSGTVAIDYGVNAKNGTYNGSPSLNQTPGPPMGGGAAHFDGGTTQYMSVVHNAVFNLGDVFTLEAWVNCDDVSVRACIVSKQTGSYDLAMAAGGKLSLTRSNVIDLLDETAQGIFNGVWAHVVATKNGATRHIYVGGVEVAGSGTNDTCVDDTSPLNIGKDQDTFNNEHWKGLLAHVAVYPTELTSARVAAHFSAANSTPIAMLAYSGFQEILI